MVVEPVLLELFEGDGVIGQHAATSGAIRQRGEQSGARCTLLDRRNVRRFGFLGPRLVILPVGASVRPQLSRP